MTDSFKAIRLVSVGAFPVPEISQKASGLWNDDRYAKDVERVYRLE